MRQFLIILLIIFGPANFCCIAQIIEDFSDGNIYSNPQWFGDTSKFRVNNSLMLQSNGIAASDDIYVSIEHSKYQNTIWEFNTIQAFPTSTGNHVRFYLASDSLNLVNATKAYFLKIGGESGNDDSIDLYYEENGSKQKLIDGIDGFCGKDSNVNVIRIKKSFEGLWTLYADSGDHNMIFQGSAFSNEVLKSIAMGISFKHSSSRRDKFYIDDIRIKNGAFQLQNADLNSSNELNLRFSNPIDSITTGLNNFNLLNSTNSIQEIRIDSNQIQLNFLSDIEPGLHELQIWNLIDDEGQILNDTIVELISYQTPEFEDIIFNEVMFDPEPTVSLPEHEFVEILNTGNADFQLGGLTYSDLDDEVILPDFSLKEDSYLILCDIKDTAEFQQYGQVLGLENWLSLNNSGDLISLRRGNELIDAFEFNSNSHSDPIKKSGGWSIERIDPIKKCDKYENWQSSQEFKGGTPGKENSVFDNRIDSTGPALLKVEIKDEKNINLIFNETLNFPSSQNLVYDIDWASSLIPNSLIHDTLKIISSIPLESGRSYKIEIDSIQDCEGNWSYNMSKSFHFGASANEFELVFNEIYSDPGENELLPDSEYLELINASDRVINCGGIKLIDNKDTVILPNVDLIPGEILLLCPENKMNEFSNVLNIHSPSKWISLSNGGEKLQLIQEGRIIHFVEYDKIFEALDFDESGISIEMKNGLNPCDISNWTKCLDIKGGTPGLPNSVLSEKVDSQSPRITEWYFTSDSSVFIELNEYVNEKIGSNSNIQINPELGKVLPRIEWVWNDQLEISFEESFEHDIQYELKIKQGRDCLDNYMLNHSTDIFIARPAKTGDIIITEILFEPLTGESEFLEIFIESNDKINLKNCLLELINTQDSSVDTYAISQKDLILNPDDYYVLCEDSGSIKRNYPYAKKRNFIQMMNFPSLPNDGRQIAILDSSHSYMDKMTYSDKNHFALLDDSRGVSLERILLTKSSEDSDNWTSASENSGYGTPGYRNSHSFSGFQSENFTLNPEIFSPDGDGFQDQIAFRILSSNPSSATSLRIFNINGRFIHSIVENSNLGAENTFIWDGILNDGQKVKAGIYLAVLDIINTEGKSERIKKSFSVGLKL